MNDTHQFGVFLIEFAPSQTLYDARVDFMKVFLLKQTKRAFSQVRNEIDDYFARKYLIVGLLVFLKSHFLPSCSQQSKQFVKERQDCIVERPHSIDNVLDYPIRFIDQQFNIQLAESKSIFIRYFLSQIRLDETDGQQIFFGIEVVLRLANQSIVILRGKVIEQLYVQFNDRIFQTVLDLSIIQDMLDSMQQLSVLVGPVLVRSLIHRNRLQHAFPCDLSQIGNGLFAVGIYPTIFAGQQILELLERPRIYLVSIIDEYIVSFLDLCSAAGSVGDGHQLDYLLIGQLHTKIYIIIVKRTKNIELAFKNVSLLYLFRKNSQLERITAHQKIWLLYYQQILQIQQASASSGEMIKEECSIQSIVMPSKPQTRPKSFITTSPNVEKNYIKAVKGSRSDTKELNINIKTLTLAYLKQLASANELSKEETEIISNYSKMPACFDSTTYLFFGRQGQIDPNKKAADHQSDFVSDEIQSKSTPDKDARENIRRYCKNLYRSPFFIKSFFRSSRMHFKNKLIISKYLKKIEYLPFRRFKQKSFQWKNINFQI